VCAQDLWELYHDRLGFLDAVDPCEIWIRTSTEDRTMQVAGAMLAAMDPQRAGQPWAVHTQPASVRPPHNPRSAHKLITHATKKIDSLVPAYACPAANAVRDAFQAVPAWTDHLRSNASLKARLDAVFGTAGLDAWASWCTFQRVLRRDDIARPNLDDHFFDALTARTCHGHPLPCNDIVAGACVSEADAAAVFAIGDFEYECVSLPISLASLQSSLCFVLPRRMGIYT
jgi:2-phosphoxylose phosphatase